MYTLMLLMHVLKHMKTMEGSTMLDEEGMDTEEEDVAEDAMHKDAGPYVKCVENMDMLP